MDWLRTFLAGRLGPWRTAAIVWLVAAAIMVWKASVWSGFQSLDTDDAMRIVQIRDWLAGQSWFDTTQYRADPPAGFSMHWSRMTDLAVAGLMAAFRTVMTRDGAEFAAMVAWPLLQFFAALLLVGVVAGDLAGRRAQPLSMVLFGMTGTATILFRPGHIDHHGLQFVAALAMLAAAMRLRGASPWPAVAAAFAGAFVLAVGLEALPYWLVICAYVSLVVVFDGAKARKPVIVFGLTLAAATPLVALATNPSRYVLSAACDQVAYPVLGLAVVGGLGLAMAGALASHIRASAARLLTAAAVGLAAAGVYVALGPECLRGPFASFDPRLTPIWINLVEEMTSLPVLLGRGDPTAWAYLSSMALGGLALAVLLARPSGRNLQTALVGAVFLAASALTLAQIRNGAYALSLACPLLAAAVVNLVLRLRVPFRHRNVALLSAALLGTATPAGAGMLARFAQNASDGVESAAGPALPAGGGCSAPSSYAPLASLAPGLAVAPIDAGPFILMASPLSILSAPYHRNPEGILAAHAILTAPLPQAAALLRRRRARYVVICLHAPGTDLPARLAPQGLAAQLEAGATPSWLKPLAVGSGVVRVYELRAPPAAAGQAR